MILLNHLILSMSL